MRWTLRDGTPKLLTSPTLPRVRHHAYHGTPRVLKALYASHTAHPAIEQVWRAPLVIVSERKDHLQPYRIDAYVVWPEAKQGRESIERILQFSLPIADDEIARVMRLSAVEGVKHHSAVWANDTPAPVDAINLKDADLERLHALRSIGLYPGLDDSRLLDGHASKFVSEQRPPLAFDR